MNTQPSLSDSVMNLSNAWTKRARDLLQSVPCGSTISDLYWWHWSNRGTNDYRGFRAGPDNIGRKTYSDIRTILIRKGFPDLSDHMFRPDV